MRSVYGTSTGIDTRGSCGGTVGRWVGNVAAPLAVARATAGSVMDYSRSLDSQPCVLCVAADRTGLGALGEAVESHWPQAAIETTTDPTVVPDLLTTWGVDCVVAEPGLSLRDSTDLRAAVRERQPTLPVVEWAPDSEAGTPTGMLGARLDDALDRHSSAGQPDESGPAAPSAGAALLRPLLAADTDRELFAQLARLIAAHPTVTDTDCWQLDPATDDLDAVDGSTTDRSPPAIAVDAIREGEPRIAAGESLPADGTAVAYPLGSRSAVSVRIEEWSLAVRERLGRLAAVAGACLGHTREYAELEGRFHRLAERNRELSQFARTVSHDLNSPLSVIYGRIELALAEPSEADIHLQAARNAAQRVDSLLTDHLQRIETTDDEETERVSIQTVAIQAWRIVDPSLARLQIEPQLETVEANAIRLQQLFENLIRNAIEHGSEESVGLGSTTETDPHAVFDDETESVTVTIKPTPKGFAVCDDGPGIPPAERSEVFESGYTTTESGSGLGLHIVQEIVTAHGWEISVDESDSGGAQFEVDLR